MSFQPTQQEIQTITREVIDVWSKTGSAYPEKEVTSSSGRVYKVVHTIETTDGELTPSCLFTRGMHHCHVCNHDRIGSSWTRFSYGDHKVHLYVSLIHLFEEHPEAVEKEELAWDKIKNVFLV